MKKINLEQKIYTVRGIPVKTPVFDRETGKPKIGKDKQPILQDSTVRICLLTLLGTRFQVIDNKEHHWTIKLGIMISEEKTKVLEISDDKFKFLKRILTKNKHKIIRQTPMGPTELQVDIFFPYEMGQLLEIFDEETIKD